MSQQRYQFNIRHLTILVLYSAFLASDVVSAPGSAFYGGIVGCCMALRLFIKRGAGIPGAMIVLCVFFVVLPIAFLIQFHFFGDPGVFDGLGPKGSLVAEFACGLILGAIVSALIYTSFGLLNRYIDRLRPDDDSCGPIVWRRLDDTPAPSSDSR